MVGLYEGFSINDQGHLSIGGHDAVSLAKEFGTPLYVLDERVIRARIRSYVKGFKEGYPDFTVVYAGKALLTSALCRIIDEEGLFLDVVSGGELYTALHADFPAERVFFHGNNKSRHEIEMAVAAGVHRIVVDNVYELDMVSEVAREAGRVVSILLRLTPGVGVQTHAHMQTGHEDSKFGIPIRAGAEEAVEKALRSPSLDLKGFHVHIGSQILAEEPYRETIRVIFDFLSKIRESQGFVAAEFNLGGGLGVSYLPSDRALTPETFAQLVSGYVRTAAEQAAYPLPKLIVEPGRSIVAPAGLTLYTVGSIKEIPGRRTYISVDGGMTDNPRVAMYGARYHGVIANRLDEPITQVVSVAGKCCETGDMLIWEMEAPRVEPGDLLAVFGTGAYNYSMASNYNRLPKPAMVLVDDHHADLIVARETYEDLVRLDRIPERLSVSKGRTAAWDESRSL